MKNVTVMLILLVSMSSCTVGNSESWLIERPEHDLVNEPVFVVVSAQKFDEGVICLSSEYGVQPAQVEQLDAENARIWWLATQPAGEAVRYTLDRNASCARPAFSWQNIDPQMDRLYLNDRPVLQYEYPVFDYDDIEHTKKPFHQVFSPNGSRLITKGTGGLYPHHRGIYLGFYVYIDGSDERIDIWHARNGERSEHNRMIRKIEGPVLGGHVLSIDWKDLDGEVFIDEVREVRTFVQPDGQLLIDVRSELTALRDTVLLGGDRHHAGLQYRAAQEVADNREATRFIRPDVWSYVPADAELGDDNILDFPWNAMYFEIEDQTYTVAYLSHPSNPAGAEMSERLYGRFGEFFSKELTRVETLVMNYRFWVKQGEAASRAEIQHRFENYATPPVVSD
jgi:hypothetical protein